jgi:hypothetical protein
MKLHAMVRYPSGTKRFWFDGPCETYMDVDAGYNPTDSSFKEGTAPWTEQLRLIHEWREQD